MDASKASLLGCTSAGVLAVGIALAFLSLSGAALACTFAAIQSNAMQCTASQSKGMCLCVSATG
jgi:hypothetical protein